MGLVDGRIVQDTDGISIITKIANLNNQYSDLIKYKFNFVNVMDKQFGAKCDGVTDDSAAIISAITFASTIGGIVFIPYTSTGCLIGSTIDLPDNAYILGNKTRLISKLTATLGGGSCPTKIFNKTGGSNITIESIILDGNFANSTWEQGVGVQQNNLLYLENVTGIQLLDFELTNFRNNKETGGGTPNTFYPAFFKNCNRIYADDLRQTGLINNEGICFIGCTKLHVRDFYSYNEQCWTPLHLWYCDGVLFENPNINEDVARDWDTASTINIYSKNVRFVGGSIVGGKGIDPSDEYQMGNGFISENVTFENVYVEGVQGFYTSTSSLIKNLNILNCRVKTLKSSVTLYTMQVDGFKMKGCILDTSDTTSKGLSVDTRSGGYLINARIEDNTFTGHDSSIYLYLRQGLGFSNVKIKKNTLYPSTLETKDSYTGSSGGIVVYLYNADAMTGAYFKNITIEDNEINAEGSYIFFATSDDSTVLNSIDVKKVKVLNNNGFSTRNPVKRGIQLRAINKPYISGNSVFQLDGQNVISYCSDIRLMNNQTELATSVTGASGWRLENCSGTLNSVGNTNLGTSNRNHLYSDNGCTFTAKSIIGNIPSTIDTNI